jgi:hypothetical protein
MHSNQLDSSVSHLFREFRDDPQGLQTTAPDDNGSLPNQTAEIRARVFAFWCQIVEAA